MPGIGSTARGAWELGHGQGALDWVARACQIVEDEGVAIGGEGVGHVEGAGVVDGLLHPRSRTVRVVLRLDHCEREVRLEEEQVVGPHLLAAHSHLARTRTRPAVNEYSRRICAVLSHPAAWIAGVMNWSQMSDSDRDFLDIETQVGSAKCKATDFLLLHLSIAHQTLVGYRLLRWPWVCNPQPPQLLGLTTIQ